MQVFEREVQTFTRDLIDNHSPGVEWPDFLGAVRLGETFVVETERYNRANGPIAIEGIRAGEAIAVHIEAIDILPPFESPNGGPFFEGVGDPVPLEYRDGTFHYPNGLVLPAKPSVGNVAVLPAPTDRILSLSRRDLGPPREGHHPIPFPPHHLHLHHRPPARHLVTKYTHGAHHE